MLYRASIQDVKESRVTRRRGHLAVTMQYYPRFLTKDLIDEYVRDLAPDRALFSAFKAKDRELKDHDEAFRIVRYEERFGLAACGVDALERLSGLSRERDVFLLCQCRATERCHTDLLLLGAKRLFGAAIAYLRHGYARFEQRLEVGRFPAPVDLIDETGY